MNAFGMSVYQEKIAKVIEISKMEEFESDFQLELPDYFEQGKYVTRVKMYGRTARAVICVEFKVDYIDLDDPNIDL